MITTAEGRYVLPPFFHGLTGMGGKGIVFALTFPGFFRKGWRSHQGFAVSQPTTSVV